jgi:hypothetical protein
MGSSVLFVMFKMPSVSRDDFKTTYRARSMLCMLQHFELTVQNTNIRSSQEHADRLRLVVHFLGALNWKFLHVLK